MCVNKNKRYEMLELYPHKIIDKIKWKLMQSIFMRLVSIKIANAKKEMQKLGS